MRSAFLFFLCLPLMAQRQLGELRIQITDATGAPLAAAGELVSQATQVHYHFTAGTDGHQTIAALPFGIYHLSVRQEAFAPYSALVEIRSAVPVALRVSLGVSPVETTLQVTASDTLLNPNSTGSVQQIGPETLRDRRSSAPARAIVNLVDTQPGWLLEANGVLHPRGSEYDVQYVVDGLPLLENRSPAFAPMFDIDEFESLTVRTGGYPAEYGHKLGGVIEVTTARDTRPGLHGKATFNAGSFATAGGDARLQFADGKNTFGAAGDFNRTDRYLDPPVAENYTNYGFGGGAGVRWERDWSDADRTRIQVRRSRSAFLVPNERLQEQAGQRQDRTAIETAGQAAWTHLVSPRVLLEVRGAGRDVAAALWSNARSTPILPGQDRGFREAYCNANVSAHVGSHDIKAGGEGLFRSIQEAFSYQIAAYRLNGIRIFDRDTPARFAFADRRQDREQGVWLQDQVRLGSVTLSAGVRWDRYRLFVAESAVSPRVAGSWQVPGAGLVLRASYDRAFQTPAIENLLLASSALVRTSLNDQGVNLPVQPSRGNFYEAGFAKSLFRRARLDAVWFRRSVRNFADDDVLLNTGVSFPIAFDRATIQGFEAKLEMPAWGRLSGFASYSNLRGTGSLPVTGGLFLDDNAGALLASTERFAITQDQRNSARARVRYQVVSRVWAAAGAQYGSGLPVEFESAPPVALLREQYGQRILDRVNFSRGRVRPSASMDASAGAELWRRENRALRAQADVFNVTGRLNVINFAGLFSGTAIAPGRWAAARMQFEF